MGRLARDIKGRILETIGFGQLAEKTVDGRALGGFVGLPKSFGAFLQSRPKRRLLILRRRKLRFAAGIYIRRRVAFRIVWTLRGGILFFSGRIGDPNTIENIILALDPGHMLTIKVGNPPAQFPYKEAIKNVSTVIYLEEMGAKQTCVRLVGIGYGVDEESQKLRGFFDKGNSYTLQKLQEKMTGKTRTLPAKPH